MKKTGTRLQVMRGTAKKTNGGLRKKDLMYNKRGKIVSKKKSIQYGGVIPNITPTVGTRPNNSNSPRYSVPTNAFPRKENNNNNKVIGNDNNEVIGYDDNKRYIIQSKSSVGNNINNSRIKKKGYRLFLEDVEIGTILYFFNIKNSATQNLENFTYIIYQEISAHHFHFNPKYIKIQRITQIYNDSIKFIEYKINIYDDNQKNKFILNKEYSIPYSIYRNAISSEYDSLNHIERKALNSRRARISYSNSNSNIIHKTFGNLDTLLSTDITRNEKKILKRLSNVDIYSQPYPLIYYASPISFILDFRLNYSKKQPVWYLNKEENFYRFTLKRDDNLKPAIQRPILDEAQNMLEESYSNLTKYDFEIIITLYKNNTIDESIVKIKEEYSPKFIINDAPDNFTLILYNNPINIEEKQIYFFENTIPNNYYEGVIIEKENEVIDLLKTTNFNKEVFNFLGNLNLFIKDLFINNISYKSTWNEWIEDCTFILLNNGNKITLVLKNNNRSNISIEDKIVGILERETKITNIFKSIKPYRLEFFIFYCYG